MWGRRSRKRKSRRINTARIDTLVGPRTTVSGDLVYSGGLHVEGRIDGDVRAEDHEDGDSVLILGEHGFIKGEVRVPNMLLNGTIQGDVYAAGRVELSRRARINGNLYYHLIEMAIGAEVNGNLIHRDENPEGAEVVESDRVGRAGEPGDAPSNS